MRNYAFLWICAVFVALLAASCSSIGPLGKEDIFLVSRTDDVAKARFLTDEGIKQYNLHIKDRKEYTLIPKIKEYFQSAIAYDPDNQDAKRYLNTMEDLRVFMHKENLKSAKNLLSKKTLTATEEYRLLKATQNAVYYDPSSKEAKDLFAKTQDRREKVVSGLLKEMDADMQKARKSKKTSEQEAAYIDAFQLSTQALAIAPNHGRAGSAKTQLRQEISKIIEKRLDIISTAIKGSHFKDAENTISTIVDLNKKLDNEFDDELNSVRYRLYFTWSQTLFNQKDWGSAVDKARIALGYRRTKEALDIIDKVSIQKDSTEKTWTFDNSIKQLDDLIAKGDAGGAVSLMQNLNRLAADPVQQKAVDSRWDKLNDFVPDLYAKGLAAYKAENPAKAIEFLELVVMIDSSYKDAQEYLDKAKDKKKLLDQL